MKKLYLLYQEPSGEETWFGPCYTDKEKAQKEADKHNEGQGELDDYSVYVKEIKLIEDGDKEE